MILPRTQTMPFASAVWAYAHLVTARVTFRSDGSEPQPALRDDRGAAEGVRAEERQRARTSLGQSEIAADLIVDGQGPGGLGHRPCLGGAEGDFFRESAVRHAGADGDIGSGWGNAVRRDGRRSRLLDLSGGSR